MTDGGSPAPDLWAVRFYFEGDHAVEDCAELFWAIDELYIDCEFLRQLGDLDPSAVSNEVRARLLHAAREESDNAKARYSEPSASEGHLLCKDHFRRLGLVTPPRPLWLRAISASSPGSVDLLGVGSVLEQVRLWLADRDDRERSADYKDDAERERLRLENLILRLEAAQKAADLMQTLGLPQEDIQAFVRRLLAPSATAVLRAQMETGFGRVLPIETEQAS